MELVMLGRHPVPDAITPGWYVYNVDSLDDVLALAYQLRLRIARYDYKDSWIDFSDGLSWAFTSAAVKGVENCSDRVTWEGWRVVVARIIRAPGGHAEG